MAKTVTASRPNARVSLKDSVMLMKQIKNKPVSKAKTYLDSLISKKRNIDGRYYTLLSKEILGLIKDGEANAEALGLDAEKLFVKNAIVSKTFGYRLPK